MTCTSRMGAATSSGSVAYARYVIKATLDQHHERAARYYAGDVAGRDVPEPAVKLRADLSPQFARRLGIDTSRSLSLTEAANLMNVKRADGNDIEGKKKHSEHRSVAEVFGLPTDRPPTVAEIENVLKGVRADGCAPMQGERAPWKPKTQVEILGQAVQRGEMSYADAESELMRSEITLAPPGAAIDFDAVQDHVSRDLLKAVDKAEWLATRPPPPMSEQAIESAQRRFKAAIGVHEDRDVTPDEIQRVANGRIDVQDYLKQITRTDPPVGFVDLTFSADKSSASHTPTRRRMPSGRSS
jgi:hypothetical protein